MKLLLSSIGDLAEYVSFSGNPSFDNLKPALSSAQEFLVRFVGQPLLEELSEDGQLSEDRAALLPYVCRPIASLGLLKFANSGNVLITDLGVMRTKTADMQDAFEWQLERAVVEMKQQAFEAIEALLRYLELKLDKFPSYANSEPYKAEKGKLIQSAGVFSQYYEINSSRLVLQTLQACMRTSEMSVRKILGNALPGLLETSLTDGQKDQLDAARRALVYLTIARALREKLVSISETGVQVNGISNFGTINYKQPASDKQLTTVLTYWDEQAAKFVSDLVTIMTPVPETPAQFETGNRVINRSIVSF